MANSGGGHTKAGRKHSETVDRIYIKEGRIHLYCGSNEQERYLFLFSDLLLVAKEKAQSSYRLKEKVRLTDIWLDDELNLEEISNCIQNPQNCFVIGWPVKNYARDLTIDNTQSSSELAWLVAKSFNLVQELPPVVAVDRSNQQDPSEKKLDPHSFPQCPYSLYVQCGKDPLFQLKGHECVFAILLYYVRDLIPANQDDSDFLDLSLIEDLASSNVNFKCSFFLKLRQ
uniref:ARHGAP20 PH domain-containing protein n=1 Tax=Romanomermis culicivorax TaxID=13658 RepID=A0A915IE28_ROMCU